MYILILDRDIDDPEYWRYVMSTNNLNDWDNTMCWQWRRSLSKNDYPGEFLGLTFEIFQCGELNTETLGHVAEINLYGLSLNSSDSDL